MGFFRRTVQEVSAEVHTDDHLSNDLSCNLQVLKRALHDSADIVIRPIPDDRRPQLLLVYVNALIDTQTLDTVILQPLLYHGLPQGMIHIRNFGDILNKSLIPVSDVSREARMDIIIEEILNASVAVLFANNDEALILRLTGFEKRGVEEPQLESSIQGPRDGFTESIRVNTSLIRRKIKNPNLVFQTYILGLYTKTQVELCYMDNLVQPTILAQVKSKLESIPVAKILAEGYVEKYIEPIPLSPFPQVQKTDRPDVAASALLEGRVVILTDGTPIALLIPMTFWTALQSVDDFSERVLYSLLRRVIRVVLFGISLVLPSLYVAITTFHPQLLPTNLLLSIAMAREGVPFPASIEAFIMEFMFEGLREAGLRLPRPIGSTVSIVGVLVIGQAAVEAGIVSAPMVIVVATTGIASLAIPRYNMSYALRLLRFPLLLIASLFGLVGLAIGLLLILIHMVNLKPFGVPYLNPLNRHAPSSQELSSLLGYGRKPNAPFKRWFRIFNVTPPDDPENDGTP